MIDTIKIKAPKKEFKARIKVTASKSESNRVLLIQALCKQHFTVSNIAIAKDTETMIRLLQQEGCVKDVGPAGTTMRFLTAFYANKKGTWLMTGSERMKNRPIHILVDALKQLGAEIEYTEKQGCPPLKINGKQLNGGTIDIDGSVSSQFLSALIMIAPLLSGGLKMNLTGKITSVPYLNMTLKLIEHFGAKYTWENNQITIEEGEYKAQDFTVEADWSAASYWYQIVALSKNAQIEVMGLKNHSLQGDKAIVEIYENFGVQTEFIDGGVRLTKLENYGYPAIFNYDFSNCPDVAQTVAATVAALKIQSKFKGLESLRIKETDRIVAIQSELGKFGVDVKILPNDEIEILPSKFKIPKQAIKTFDDHRVAMSIAPLALMLDDAFEIEEPEVVEKSYPDFWNDLKYIGFITEQ